MPKAIIIGASSGIGRALAKELSRQGYELGLAARRLNLLKSLAGEIGSRAPVRIKQLDVTQLQEAIRSTEELIREMGGLDLFVYNTGVDFSSPAFDWKLDYSLIQVNVIGFVALSNLVIDYFLKHGSGHLVGISSVAAVRGNGRSPAYSASKAFMANYLSGVRQKLIGKNIRVTEIRPGYVDTDMIKGRKSKFWVGSPEQAAQGIWEAVRKQKKVAYVPQRWWWVAQLVKAVPDFIYDLGYRRAFSKRA